MFKCMSKHRENKVRKMKCLKPSWIISWYTTSEGQIPWLSAALINRQSGLNDLRQCVRSQLGTNRPLCTGQVKSEHPVTKGTDRSRG